MQLHYFNLNSGYQLLNSFYRLLLAYLKMDEYNGAFDKSINFAGVFMDMEQTLKNSNQTIDQQQLNEALIEETIAGNINEINLLIKKGADVNIAKPINGLTPLMFAAQHGHIKIVDLLIKHGANIRATNNHNETALIIARKMHHNTLGFRLLWEMTPNQRKEYANQIISNCDHFYWFEQGLKNNANKIFDIVMPALRIGSNSPLLSGHFELPIWHKIELFKQDFPAWYQPCVQQHFELALNLAKKYHSAKHRNAFSYLTHPIPEPSNFSRLFSIANHSLSSIGNSCFNTVKPYLPSFIADRMQIEGTENNINPKMEIDGIDEPENSVVNKRKHDDKNHQEGPERKRFKDR